MILSGRLQPRRPLLRWLAVLGVTGLMSVGTLLARESAPALGWVPLAQLPVEAQVVHRAILSGGPFAYSKDGIVFGNRERMLPAERRGYYHEYTVMTPGSRDRGARRIVCGAKAPAAPAACFYTGDHYATFRRITS